LKKTPCAPPSKLLAQFGIFALFYQTYSNTLLSLQLLSQTVENTSTSGALELVRW